MGYTPLFDTLTKGTLCGRWPDIGLWPIVLSLADRNGIVDVTPTYIAGVTGLPVEEVAACMQRFCEPDPHSRSSEEGGARLVLIDDHRDWGWRIVNHGFYREKARKAAFDSERTASGRDAARKKTSRDVPRCPAVTRAGPLSDSDSDSDSDSEEDSESESEGSAEGRPRAARSARATRLPTDFDLSPDRRAIAEAENLEPERTFAKFCDYWRAASGAKARKHDWDATWRNWCRTEADRSRGNGSTPKKPRLTWRPDPKDDVPQMDDPYAR